MNSPLMAIGKKILIILSLSVFLGILGYSIDHAYFEYPLGTGTVGITTKDGNQFPATSEITFTAKDLDVIQVDLSAKTNDLEGEIEVIGPQGNVCLSTGFKVKKYPSGFLPNPGKWQSFFIQNSKVGDYKLRVTQNKHGEINAYFYQGPFILRLLLLPFLAIFVYFLFSFTFEKNKIILPKAEEQK